MDLFIILMLLTGVWIFITSLMYNFQDYKGNYPLRGLFPKLLKKIFNSLFNKLEAKKIISTEMSKNLLLLTSNEDQKRIDTEHSTFEYPEENQKKENYSTQTQNAYTETNIQEMFEEKFKQAIVQKQKEIKKLEQKLKEEFKAPDKNDKEKDSQNTNQSKSDTVIDLSNILLE